MAGKLEICIDVLLYYSGLIKLARWWNRRIGKRLVILCYHRMDCGYLREHLLYLQRHYRILHLEAALEELYAPSKEAGRSSDRRTLLALTFDDGYYDNYTYGFSLARQLQIPITIFLIPGYIENRRRFWWLESEYLLGHTQVQEATVEGRTYYLNAADERSALAQLIDTRVRFAESIVEREAFIARMHEILALPSRVHAKDDALRCLTWAEVGEMEKSEWVSFGAHTMYHPILSCLSDSAEVQSEVMQSRVELEQHLGHPVCTFAYPVGKEEHIGNHTLHAVQKAGYVWAFTAIHGINTAQTEPLQVHRIVVDVEQHWLLIAAKASGLWDLLTTSGRWLLMFIKKAATIGGKNE